MNRRFSVFYWNAQYFIKKMDKVVIGRYKMHHRKCLKRIALVSLLSAGALFLTSCKKQEESNTVNKAEEIYTNIETERKDEITFGDVLKYIENNRDKQYILTDYLSDLLLKDESGIPNSSSRNFSEIIKREIERNPDEMKDYVLSVSRIGLNSSYRREIWNQLDMREKSELVREVLTDNARDYLAETRELGKDALEKFRETRLYEKGEELGDRLTEEIKERIGGR